MEDLDQHIMELKKNMDQEGINNILEQYRPYIIKIVSGAKNGYVEVDNDEELSIGLMAFYEAIERYEINKGRFLSYAAIVIDSRIKSYLKKERRHAHQNIEDIEEMMTDNQSIEARYEIVEEIKEFEKTLSLFGITLDQLVELAPKHEDTRKTAVEVSHRTSQEEDLVDFMYEKRRLPITKIAERFFVSIKLIKRSKVFIIACVIIITRKLEDLKTWLKYD